MRWPAWRRCKHVWMYTGEVWKFGEDEIRRQKCARCPVTRWFG